MRLRRLFPSNISANTFVGVFESVRGDLRDLHSTAERKDCRSFLLRIRERARLTGIAVFGRGHWVPPRPATVCRSAASAGMPPSQPPLTDAQHLSRERHTMLKRTVRQLIDDDRGFVITVELVLIVTILVLGLIVGLSCVQAAVVGELTDVGFAVSSLNQSFFFRGFSGCLTRCGFRSFTSGSAFIDVREVLCGVTTCEVGVGTAMPVAPPAVAPPVPAPPPLPAAPVCPEEPCLTEPAPGAFLPPPPVGPLLECAPPVPFHPAVPR